MNTENTISQTDLEKITNYVYENYRSYKGKNLIINELNSCFSILKHKHGSPLFLGKNILNQNNDE